MYWASTDGMRQVKIEIHSNLAFWGLAMWDTCLCGIDFLGTAKHLLRCISSGDVGHLAMWDSWDRPLSVPLVQVRLIFDYIFGLKFDKLTHSVS